MTAKREPPPRLCRYCWAPLRRKGCPCRNHCCQDHHDTDKRWNNHIAATRHKAIRA